MLNISFLIADEWVNGVFASTLLKWFEERSSTDPKPVCKWPTATSVLAAFHTCHLLLQPVKVDWISGESRNGDKSANQSAESFDWQPI